MSPWNGAEWVAAFYGCMLRGALAVPLDAYGSADFAARVMADVKPKLAIGDAVLLGQLSNVVSLAPKNGPANGGSAEFPTLAFEDWESVLPAEEAGPVAGLSIRPFIRPAVEPVTMIDAPSVRCGTEMATVFSTPWRSTATRISSTSTGT